MEIEFYQYKEISLGQFHFKTKFNLEYILIISNLNNELGSTDSITTTLCEVVIGQLRKTEVDGKIVTEFTFTRDEDHNKDELIRNTVVMILEKEYCDINKSAWGIYYNKDNGHLFRKKIFKEWSDFFIERNPDYIFHENELKYSTKKNQKFGAFLAHKDNKDTDDFLRILGLKA